MQKNIEKQQVAVRKYRFGCAGGSRLEDACGKIQLTKLTKEIVDTFVERLFVWEERLEVKWKLNTLKKKLYSYFVTTEIILVIYGGGCMQNIIVISLFLRTYRYSELAKGCYVTIGSKKELQLIHSIGLKQMDIHIFIVSREKSYDLFGRYIDLLVKKTCSLEFILIEKYMLDV